MNTPAESVPFALRKTELEETQPAKTQPGGFEAPKPLENPPRDNAKKIKQEALRKHIEDMEVKDANKALAEEMRLLRLIMGDEAVIKSRNVTAVTPEDVQEGLTMRRIKRSLAAGTVQEEAPMGAPDHTFRGGQSGAKSIVIPEGLRQEQGRISTEPGSPLGVSIKQLEQQDFVQRAQKRETDQQTFESALPTLTDADLESGLKNIPKKKSTVAHRTQRAVSAASLQSPTQVDAEKLRRAS